MSPRPTRKDALRNYERLLDAAEEAFAREGTEVPLECIAQAAGVGIGTLYRHFPNRDELLAALLESRWIRHRELAAQLLAAVEEEGQAPLEALRAWLYRIADDATLYEGLPDACLRLIADPDSGTRRLWGEVKEGGDRLLRRAQRDGAVRADVSAAELFALTHGAVSASTRLPSASGAAQDTHRLIDLLLGGVAVPS